MGHEWIAGLIIGTLANLVAELFLALDMSRPFQGLHSKEIRLRCLRWISCLLGCGVISGLGLPISVVLLFGLFSVSAATDFETSVLPPDGFIYGAVLVSMAVGWIQSGWAGFWQVALAQAACFSVIVLAVRYLGACDSGDIKLGMQFGAMCGSLPGIVIGGLVFWLVACLTIAVAAVTFVVQARSLRVMTRVLALQLPLGPLLWWGVLGSLAYRMGWG